MQRLGEKGPSTMGSVFHPLKRPRKNECESVVAPRKKREETFLNIVSTPPRTFQRGRVSEPSWFTSVMACRYPFLKNISPSPIPRGPGSQRSSRECCAGPSVKGIKHTEKSAARLHKPLWCNRRESYPWPGHRRAHHTDGAHLWPDPKSRTSAQLTVVKGCHG